MKKGWETKKLEDLCEVEYGTRVVNKRDSGSIYPVYGGGGATFSMNSFNRENQLVIARFAISEQCTRFVKGKFFLNDSGLTIRPKSKKEILQHFLDLQILFLNDHIYSLARGTAQKNLDVPAFRNIEICYPKLLSEQQQIVSLLGETFAAIDLAKENLKQNLQNAKDLFQSELTKTFTKKGNGRVEKNLLALTTHLGDGLHGTPKYAIDGEYYFINGNNLIDGKIIFKETTKRVSLDQYKLYKKNLTDRTILVSINGTLGNVAFYNNEKIILGKSACYFNLIKDVDKHYIKYNLISPVFIKYAHKEATGATIKNVSLKSMREYKISIPSQKEQSKIVSQLDTLSAETKNLENIYQKKLDNLAELKKSILQKAFSGELTKAKAFA